ncbi:MAG: hypothetical protein AAFV86_22855, partial [Pseudomonadota bacterium]
MRTLTLILALFVSPVAAAQVHAEPPLYLIALWDGADTGPGMWFTVDGASLPGDVSLTPVHRLPPGTTIRAEAGRLVISSALARALRVAPATPTLVEIVTPSGNELARSTLPDRASELAARQARIRSLLVDLKAEAAAQV